MRRLPVLLTNTTLVLNKVRATILVEKLKRPRVSGSRIVSIEIRLNVKLFYIHGNELRSGFPSLKIALYAGPSGRAV